MSESLWIVQYCKHWIEVVKHVATQILHFLLDTLSFFIQNRTRET